MSNITLIEKSESQILAQSKKFVELSKSHKAVNFEQEASFAIQALKSNAFLAKTAAENPDSLINAIHNIASVGLSLNPALKHAYLVPRNGKVCLDFGYTGLVHLALETGGVMYVQAELVYQKDKFALKARGEEPVHERDPFNPDRGEVRGAYCIAKTANGEFLVETMTAKEIFAIRDRTDSYKAFLEKKIKSCPWSTDESEMMKKTVIRRASKLWPKTNAGRFEKAMQVQDEIEPIDVTPVASESEQIESGPDPRIQDIRNLLQFLNKEEPKFLGYLSMVNSRTIEAIEDLSDKEIEAALVQLKSWANAQKQKEAQSENSL